MSKHRLSLGQAMAYLQNDARTDERASLTKSGIFYLEELDNRLQHIENSCRAATIIKQRSKSCCQEKAAIADDVEFFLSCIVIGKQGGEKAEEVTDFIRHLNSCYKCFSVYSQVINDYYEQTKALSETSDD